MGFEKDAGFRWDAIITFSNCGSSCYCYWAPRWSWGIIICHCYSLGMCCMYFLNQVMYDATCIRFHAGRQAELSNQIMCELPPEHPVANVGPLRDSLGHTPLQPNILGDFEAVVKQIDSMSRARFRRFTKARIIGFDTVPLAQCGSREGGVSKWTECKS